MVTKPTYDELAEFIATIPWRTKHGFKGEGPCAVDCLKCQAERLLKRLGW